MHRQTLRDGPAFLDTTVLLLDGVRNVKHVPTVQTANFHMEKVKPGKYHLLAIEAFDEDEWGPDELKAALPKAVALELGESEKNVASTPLRRK